MIPGTRLLRPGEADRDPAAAADLFERLGHPGKAAELRGEAAVAKVAPFIPDNVYAGIGSRKTPPVVLAVMRDLGEALATQGWGLRSGGADGADEAFEEGCDRAKGVKQIFKADDCTDEACALSAKYHPAWDRCSGYAQWLHGRNAMILLGEALTKPVQHVFCWTPKAQVIGGTGQALRMAADASLFPAGVNVWNLARPGVMDVVRNLVLGRNLVDLHLPVERSS